MVRLTVLVAGTALHSAASSGALLSWPWNPPLPVRRDNSPKAFACDLNSFSRIVSDGITIEKVDIVQQGGSYGEGVANVPYPTNPINLPALCAVTVRVNSTEKSSYRFGLFLPDDWNGRMLTVGNGDGRGINWADMAMGPTHSGMAALSTDTGHSSAATDSAWANTKPERKTDWGWRAMKGSVDLGKKLVRAYYGDKQPLRYSYYSGCSTGGRQGLKQMQVAPDSFDGALIGAPAWWPTHLNNWITRVSMFNLPMSDSKYMSTTDMTVLGNEVIKQCDQLDGVQDNIISRPDLCEPDLSTIHCTNNIAIPGYCLTSAQLGTARNVYNDVLSSQTPNLLYPGLTPGSEAHWYVVLQNGDQPSPYGIGYQKDFLFDQIDPNWDWTTFNESVFTYADKANPGDPGATDFGAMRKVRDRGGKVMLYQGLADGLVPPKGTQLFYNRTEAFLESNGGKDVRDFLRMFLIPGMQHCWGTAVDAPWNIGAAFQAAQMGSGWVSVPGYEDAGHDALMALMGWVENGTAVESVVATTWALSMDPASGVKRQRPVCAWPKNAVWDGKGNADVPGSWNCSG
ncbi:CTP synthase ura7 [Collariella sp. IMI 366227]|nr:CTP synthase ura7 [Collariella sp. IMI 366227]